MDNIPTAQEMEMSGHYEDYQSMMIEFAKMHVKECKLQILEQFSVPVYKDLIINTYPLTNIK